ncbi:vWA domain-containing protein [Neptunicella marina]|uniref:VWA domain-containing protein n=1 Tax=Neptunicella marina TaxID=2125989 RepID=A0A8J6IV12_9ALTE|nr:VWA domain-containing protein [Neptunicella marina]MBC3766412.1 VWA domain-containing protein [Neptunicella marina]
MLIDFFFKLRQYKVGCSLTELMDLLEAMKQQLVVADMGQFYQLSRLMLVKDETRFDRFDRAFADYFDGLETFDLLGKDIPEDWLRKQIERYFSEDEKRKLEAMGGLDKLLDTLQQRMQEQQKRHQGGNKWIGTGGTSPFGAHGFNPEGVRMGSDQNGQFRAVKVWEKRQFKDLDGQQSLGTRNLQLALRKLRQFARTGANQELDMATTIDATASNAGLLDLKWLNERHNAVKVLILFDIGGSMDFHIAECEKLFSAVKSEFKHLEYFYFHNCVYEHLWTSAKRQQQHQVDVWDVIHKYGSDYKLILVGDATMGPYEINYAGGSVEHWNEEPGSIWMNRLLHHFDKAVWLNPQPQQHWVYYASIGMIQQIMEQRMFTLTPDGISQAITKL